MIWPWLAGGCALMLILWNAAWYWLEVRPNMTVEEIEEERREMNTW
jgi:hypothetical protein